MISTHIALQYVCLKPTHSIWSVFTSICSIRDSNLYTVHDQFSHRSAVYVTQTYTQYMISSHIDLQYMWLKPIQSIWSVLTSICSICDSNLYAVHDQFSHRSAVYVTQTYTQYMTSTHIDLQYMWLKPIRSKWSVLTSVCSTCDSNRYAVYDLYSHRSAVYGTQTDAQYMISSHIDLLYMWLKSIGCIWSVLTLTCSEGDSYRYAVYDSIHIDLQFMWVKSVRSVWSVLTSICSISDSNRCALYVQGSYRSAIGLHVTPNRSPVYVQPSHRSAVSRMFRPRASLRSMFSSKPLRSARTWMTRNRIVLWLWKFKNF
jgi:hypothetical protein